MEADKVLVAKAKKGDIEAFSELVIRHQKSLVRMAYRVLNDLEAAQDVVQESLFKAYQKLDTFEGRSAFKSWAYQITLNTAKNKLRGRRPELVEVEKIHVSDDVDLEGDMMGKDLRGIVKNEIDRLPTKQRIAISLRIFDDLSFAEIAQIMECPYDTAKANYRHALIKLRHTLGEAIEFKPWKTELQKSGVEMDA